LFGHKYLKTVQILLDQIIRKILNKIVSVKFGLIHTVSSETESVYLQKLHKTCVVTHYAQTIFILNEKQTQPLSMELVIKTSNTRTSFYHGDLRLYIRLT
jgi:hypothetical protein